MKKIVQSVCFQPELTENRMKFQRQYSIQKKRGTDKKVWMGQKDARKTVKGARRR